MDRMSWDDQLVDGLGFIENHVLQAPLFLMSMMRYMTPTLDDLFMSSLRWVDHTYAAKHADDPARPRAMYYPALRQYRNGGGDSDSPPPAGRTEAVARFVSRFARKAAISLLVYVLSCVPYLGRAVLPLASYYTFKEAVGLAPASLIFSVGVFLPKRYLVIFLQSYFASRSLVRELLEPYFKRVRFTREEKKKWFRAREGLLFGFGIGFYVLLKVPLLGVLVYGIAEAVRTSGGGGGVLVGDMANRFAEHRVSHHQDLGPAAVAGRERGVRGQPDRVAQQAEVSQLVAGEPGHAA